MYLEKIYFRLWFSKTDTCRIPDDILHDVATGHIQAGRWSFPIFNVRESLEYASSDVLYTLTMVWMDTKYFSFMSVLNKSKSWIKHEFLFVLVEILFVVFLHCSEWRREVTDNTDVEKWEEENEN